MLKGTIEFQGEKCVFELDEVNFILKIESITNRGFDEEYFKRFASFKPFETIHQGALVGKVFDEHKFIYFDTHNMTKSGHNQFSGIVKSYFISYEEELLYDTLNIYADELNYFYNGGRTYSVDRKTGSIYFEADPEKYDGFSFDFGNQSVEAELRVTKKIRIGALTPINLNTLLKLKFCEAKELTFAEDLALLIRRLLMFVTFRRNVNYTQLTLSKNSDEVGEFFVNVRDSYEEETDSKVQERIVDYPLINEHLKNLVMDLIEEEVYLMHLPDSIQDSRFISPAKYIMVTAGFEWEFSRSLEDKLTKENTTKYKDEIQSITDFFDDKIEETSGKKKKFYKSTKNRALGGVGQAYTLQQKLTFAFEEFNEVLNMFIKHIFSLNGIEFESNYSELAERIADRRNAVGHGNIAKEAHEWHGIDLYVLEWLYYAMVLRAIGMDDHRIKASINKLFRRGFAL